jgi:opacity protein-like surface antigen
MKRVLLASSALALLAGAGSAQAGAFDGVYINVFGGGNWQEDNSGRAQTTTGGTLTTLSYDFESSTGFVVGGSIGTNLWMKGLRGEVEVSYRRNDVGGNWVQRTFTTPTTPTSTYGGPIDANSSTFAVMANVWYDLPLGWKIRPYVGGGIGWGRSQLDGVLMSTSGYSILTAVDVEHSGFAYQLGAGFNVEVAPGVDVGLGYRYFNAPNVRFEIPNAFAGSDFAGKFENDSHSVSANLTIHTN